MQGKSTVGDYVTLQRGLTYKGNLVGRPGPALLGLGSIRPGGGFREADYKTYGGDCPLKLLLSPGDLFASLKGATKDGKMVGSVARVPASVSSGRLTQDTVKLQFHDSDPQTHNYLYWILRTPQYRAYCEGRATGSAVVALSRDDFLDYPVPAITATRMQIVDLLEALEAKIELNRRMNETLEGLARAIFQSWFVDFDPVRAKRDDAAPHGLSSDIAALFPDSFEDSELGKIPKGWSVGTINDATSLIIDYRGKTPKKMGSDWSERGIPAVSAKNVKAGRLVRPETCNFVSEELYEKWMKEKLAIGDILMTSEAPLGELFYLALDARFCLSQRVFALRANPVRCESTFLYYWLHSASCQTEIINRGTGTTVEGIRQSELRKVAVLIPPLAIQKSAAKFLADWTEQIHHNEVQSCQLAAIRDALLPKLLSGELRLTPYQGHNYGHN